MVGSIYHNYTVIDVNSKRPYHWVCKCICGVIKDVRYSHLKRGKVKSCGCHKNAIATTHGFTKGATHGKRMAEYNVWAAMLRRCKNVTEKSYYLYGGRGIMVCEEWHKFENFIKDMGLRPSDKHSIDRFPNKDGNYEPSNCRWATIAQQNRNLRSNIWVEYNGVSKIVADWAAEFNIDPSYLRKKILSGKSIGEVISKFKNRVKV